MDKTNKAQETVEIVKKDLVWNGFVKLHKVTAKLPSKDTKELEIEREIHDHGNATAVLPVDKGRQTALMVSQWRIPAFMNGHADRLWEAPAGIIDAGESAENAAKREALEETGYEICNLRLVGRPFASPGLVTEQVDIFLADYTSADKKSDQIGCEDEGEDLELKEFTFSELFTMIEKAQIFDAVTMIAIYALREEIRAK